MPTLLDLGNAGSVLTEARDQVQFEGNSSAFSRSGSFSDNGQVINAKGTRGGVHIFTTSLSVSDRAQLNAQSTGGGIATQQPDLTANTVTLVSWQHHD